MGSGLPARRLLEAGDPGEINAHLRRLWSAAVIGRDMSVVDVEWIVPAFMHNEALSAEWEASADANHGAAKP